MISEAAAMVFFHSCLSVAVLRRCGMGAVQNIVHSVLPLTSTASAFQGPHRIVFGGGG